MPHPSCNPDDKALHGLRLRWVLYVLLCLAVAASGYIFLRLSWDEKYAVRWLILTSLALVFLVIILWRNLPLNYPPEDSETQPRLYPDLGAGNTLTLLRGLLIAGLAGFLWSPVPAGWLEWLPGLLYMAASLGDFLDGALARLTDHVTRLGEVLDMEHDSLGVLAIVLLVVQYGQAPAWYILVGLARYVFVGGLWLRKRLNLPVYKLPFSVRRRTLAGLQMGFLVVLLLPIFGPPGTFWVSAAFGIPLLLGFLWDWFHVIGRITETEQSIKQQHQWASWSGFILRWLAVVFFLLQGYLFPDTRDNLPIFGSLLTISVILIALGIAGRVNALLALWLTGLLQSQSALTGIQLVGSLVYCGILMLGTGPYSIWAPEDRLVFQRIGYPSPKQIPNR